MLKLQQILLQKKTLQTNVARVGLVAHLKQHNKWVLELLICDCWHVSL